MINNSINTKIEDEIVWRVLSPFIKDSFFKDYYANLYVYTDEQNRLQVKAYCSNKVFKNINNSAIADINNVEIFEDSIKEVLEIADCNSENFELFFEMMEYISVLIIAKVNVLKDNKKVEFNTDFIETIPKEIKPLFAKLDNYKKPEQNNTEVNINDIQLRVLKALKNYQVDNINDVVFNGDKTLALCSDTFMLACADAELVTSENIDVFENTATEVWNKIEDGSLPSKWLQPVVSDMFSAEMRKMSPLTYVLNRRYKEWPWVKEYFNRFPLPPCERNK